MVDVIDRVMKDQQLKDHWIRRGVAYIIDSVIIFIVILLLVMIAVIALIGSVIGGAMAGNPIGGVAGGLMILFIIIIIALLFSIGYWVYFDAKGGTPGKRFMKLRPVALQGGMDYPKALIRNLSKIVGGFIGSMLGNILGGMIVATLVEWIIVGLDAYMGISKGEDPRRKYTDFLAGTTVMRTDLAETFAPGAQAPSPPLGPPTPTPVATTADPATSMVMDHESSLNTLRDRFLLGEITEEEYKKERQKLTGAT